MMGLTSTQIAPAVIVYLDLFGIAVFAASGALAAAKLRQTLVTFSFFALVTGVGGGTVRDLLIGAPVFWIGDWRFAATCLGTAGLVWMTPRSFWNENGRLTGSMPSGFRSTRYLARGNHLAWACRRCQP
jgi:uncharacterized membrane protein YeiH